MRLKKINIVTAIAFGAVLLFTGCTKDDGAVPKRVQIEDVPVVTTNIDATGSPAINLLDLASFQGKFKVDLYFPDATPPSKVDVMVRKNGSAGNVKLFKADVTTLPSSFTINAAELAALFGAPVALGDTYDFAPSLYISDKKYDAFPATGNGTGAGVNGMPGFGEFARFAAICAYDPAIYEGDFEIVSDAWANGPEDGTAITLTRVSANSFRMTYPNIYVTPASPTPSFVVTINTGNNNATVAKQEIGATLAQYTLPNVEGSGSVAPCDKTATLNITYTVAQGSFGTHQMVIRKK